MRMKVPCALRARVDGLGEQPRCDHSIPNKRVRNCGTGEITVESRIMVCCHGERFAVRDDDSCRPLTAF